ncbi:MAG: L-glutamate gamma-semialdehyde dehydrogenase [Gemmatimonadota bacterium]
MSSKTVTPPGPAPTPTSEARPARAPARGGEGGAVAGREGTIAPRAAHLRPPPPANEPVLGYVPGSPERAEIRTTLQGMSAEEIEIPLIIGGEEVRTGQRVDVVMPHDHGHILARAHRAGTEETHAAIEAAREAWREWSAWSWEDRAAVFLRAAELLAGPWRATLNAATMLGQSKTVHQAEIDAACELIDFWRFNVHFASRLYEEQPESAPGQWNQLDHRPLEGFVYAITPFNFTSIGGNLPTSPAIMGNVSIWKPATTAILSSYYIMRVLEEAGLPPGVINFVPGDSAAMSEVLLASPELAGIHFTGSTATFQLLWRQVAENLSDYRSYPRVVGETGGKDFIVAHASADPQALAVAVVRGAFEYQGQKCSAASRVYVPANLWPEVRDRVGEMLSEIRVGDPADFQNFMAAVIDRSAFDSITGYIEHARQSAETEIVFGGGFSDEVGYFIDPTVVLAQDPGHRLMCEEIFGPVVTVHVYPEKRWEETLALVDATSPYALTGAVFAREGGAIRQAASALRHAAGNFYINDKPTGAVVGKQPFGGGRASGTNDKAGSILNLLRWVSPRAIKETFAPPRDYRYPFLAAD